MSFHLSEVYDLDSPDVAFAGTERGRMLKLTSIGKGVDEYTWLKDCPSSNVALGIALRCVSNRNLLCSSTCTSVFDETAQA